MIHKSVESGRREEGGRQQQDRDTRLGLSLQRRQTHTDDGRQIDGEREKEKESEREWKKANDDERVREREEMGLSSSWSGNARCKRRQRDRGREGGEREAIVRLPSQTESTTKTAMMMI